ncbi:MAG: RDD family protein [Gracilimonas sp.]|uniref:RDD family protein n=1 Tax=Gracilimonas sp. TaxID=1974203 RepID=UPI001986475C|nr:RDD family protein [Gracilimonas sp.]MBD3616331.1 RDD family protein [Gracilimonas sp.]
MVGIETSQHVKLSYEPAGVGERILAFFLDGFFIGVYYLVVIWIWGYVNDIGANPESAIQDNIWILYIVLVLPMMLYHLISELISNGYSLGKKIVGIRVVKVDGTRATLSGYLVRWMFRLVEITMTSGVLAFVAVIMNGKGQRIGDILGKTCVIKERKNVKLDNTLFAEVADAYKPVFPQVAELADKDIRIIKEVLDSRSHYDYDNWFLMLQKTRKKIEDRLGVKDHDLRGDEFLKTVIKDYNAIHGK